MARLIWVLIFALLSGASFAGEDIDAKLKVARQKLDAAARELAELHKAQFGMGDDKAMLGILLGEGPSISGIELVGVTPGGGAEAAGLQTGDIIVRIGGVSLDKADDPMHALVDYMKNIKPGEQVTVRYRRGDLAVDTQITTEAHSRHMMEIIRHKEPLVAVELERLIDQGGPGVRIVRHESVSTDQLMDVEGSLAEYFEVARGVVVTGAGAESQLRNGDVLLTIGGTQVSAAATAAATLAQLESATDVTVKRKGKTRRLQVQPGEFQKAQTSKVRVNRVVEGDDTEGDDVYEEIREDLDD